MLGKNFLTATPRFANQIFNGRGFFKIPGQLAALRPVLLNNCRQASTSPRLWVPSLTQVSFLILFYITLTYTILVYLHNVAEYNINNISYHIISYQRAPKVDTCFFFYYKFQNVWILVVFQYNGHLISVLKIN